MKASGVLLAILAFLGLRWFLQHQYQTVITAATSPGPSSCLTMLGNTTRDEDGRTYIVGAFRNDCGRRVSHVTLIFKAPGPVDSKFNSRDAFFQAYESDVQPGETRHFKTMFGVGKDTIYRFDRFAAY